MRYSRHGGECCGISIVHGFDYARPQDLNRIINIHDTEATHGNPVNRLLEAVLIDRQLDPQHHDYDERIHPLVREAGGWAAILERHGFVLKTRFLNSNSHRFCNIFHRVSTPEPIEGLRWQNNEEGEIQQQEPEAVVVPAPVFENRVSFFAICRDGTRAGPFETEELARQSCPSVSQYIRVETDTLDGEVQQILETFIAA